MPGNPPPSLSSLFAPSYAHLQIYRIAGHQPPHLRCIFWSHDITNYRQTQEQLQSERQTLIDALDRLRPLEVFFRHTPSL